MTSPPNPSVAFSPVLARNLADVGWSHIELLATVGSTNKYALESPQSWHVVAADDQQEGRGRLDRSWEVPPGVAATVSFTVPLWMSRSHSTRTQKIRHGWIHDDEAQEELGWIPLFAGLATLRALRQVLPHVVMGLKWPNDILVEGSDGEWRKVCGILCQMTPDGEHVVIGIGVNVAQTHEQLPIEQATSLMLEGLAATEARQARDDVLVALSREVMRVARRWSDPAERAELRGEYRKNCRSVGALVEVHVAGQGPQTKRVTDIDAAGRIVTVDPSDRSDKPFKVTYAVADIIHARLKGQS